jgi:Nucleoside-diphosphate-sugar epimerases
MKVIITGNMGYIGPTVVEHFRQVLPNSTIIGVDTGFFAHCITQSGFPERAIDIQLFRDVRDLEAEIFAGIDAVVHLAAISNDPMGTRFADVTDEINARATIRVAELAASRGVRRFVFASSCSIYGFAEGGARSEGDELNPLTAYARSKVDAERGLERVSAESDMVVTALRFATACGFSSRTRLDLVLNDFVASALSTGRISVLSDGKPWRPLIHVGDMARAMEWSLFRPATSDDRFLAVNVGAREWTYQVADLAEAVRAAIPGTQIDINPNAQPDKRSYRVDFGLFRSLAPDHQPKVSLEEAIAELRDGLTRVGFQDPHYRSSRFVRLNVLGEALEDGRLRQDLRWSDRNWARPLHLPPLLDRQVPRETALSR